MIQLRPYQAQTLEAIDAHLRGGKRRVLVTLPTGCGKMVIAAELLRRFRVRASNRHAPTQTLFLAHVAELVEQCSAKLHNLGVPHARVGIGGFARGDEPTLLGTVQSFRHRVKSGRINPQHIRLIVVDEAHHIQARTYLDVLELFPEAVVVGFTATPTRLDGKGLGDVFEEIIQTIGWKQAVNEGYLARPRYFTPQKPDLSGVRVRAGDYADDDLERVMRDGRVVGKIVDHWLRFAKDRSTIGFATKISHSFAMAQAFQAAGVTTAHLDGSTPRVERQRILHDLETGRIQVLWNVNVFGEGVDVPNVSCIINARPTQSVTLWVQSCGRGLRPGKADCLILDHAGNYLRHGALERYEHWSLRSGKVAPSDDESPVQTARTSKPFACINCKAQVVGSRVCPACGFVHAAAQAPEELPQTNGRLEEVTVQFYGLSAQDWIAQLYWIALAHGYNNTWLPYALETRFPKKPPAIDWRFLKPIAPCKAVREWAWQYFRSARYRYRIDAVQDAHSADAARSNLLARGHAFDDALARKMYGSSDSPNETLTYWRTHLRSELHALEWLPSGSIVFTAADFDHLRTRLELVVPSL